MVTGTRLTGTTLKAASKPRSGRQECSACGVRLSSYNPGPHCFAHTLDVPWRGPGVRPR